MNYKLLTYLFCLLFLFSLKGNAQDYTEHNWYFTGSNESILFGKERLARPIVDTRKVAQNNIGEKVTATDPISGDLIFYSDGVNIFDDTHAVMENGDGILTDAMGSQALATSPVPGLNSEDLFYLFHRSPTGEILYTIVDRSITANRIPGLPAGAVVAGQKNISTGITNRGDGLITIGSEDLSTFWLISQDLTDSTIQIHEIPPAGGTFIQEGAGLNLTNPILVDNMTYDNETNQIALVPENQTNIEIIQFEEGNPTPLNAVRTIFNSFVFGETFGGTVGWGNFGQYLFFSRNSNSGGNIYAFDMLDQRDDAIPVAVLDDPIENSYSLKLAPDSAIYHIYQAVPNGDLQIGRILQFETFGEDFDYEPEALEMTDLNSEFFSQFGPLANIQPEVTAIASSDVFCMNNPIQFFPEIDPSNTIPTQYFWDFQAFGITSELQAPVVSFEQAGFLSARVSVEINGRTFTSDPIMGEVQQNDLQVSLQDTTICEGETLTLDAEPEQGGQGQQGGATGGPFTYLWNTGETSSSIEVTEAGDYWVVVTPQTGCAVYATASVLVYGDDDPTANIWYFGSGAGIDFNEEEGLDPPPRSITEPHAMNAPEGTSTISDSNGDVLFYTNGTSVWNRENNVMPNGNEIGGDSTSTQAAIIIPSVNDETLFYIFTTKEVYGEESFEVKYSLIDLKEDDGRGDVVAKDIVLFSNSTEKIAAFDAGNGFWVLTHEYGNNTFRAYPVLEEGIGSPVISSAGGVHSYNDPLSGRAGMKFSSGGDRVAVAIIEGEEDYVEVFDFDPQRGRVTEFNYRIDLNEGGRANDQVYDVHFSPGTNKLYATLNNRNTEGAGGRILEYRVDTLSTEDSRLASRADISIGSNLNVNFGQIQTTPNGQLFVAVETPGDESGSAFVSSINVNEDTLSNSSLTPQAVLLTTGFSRLGLPSFVQNNSDSQDQPAMTAPEVICIEERIALSGNGTSDIDEFLWTITDQSDNSTIFSAPGQDTAYVFPAGQIGDFSISLNISNRCGFDTTLVQDLRVFDLPALTVPQAVSVCEGDVLPLTAGPDDPNLVYEWTNSQGAVVSNDREFIVRTPEIYTVSVRNIIAGCTNSAQVFAGPPFDIELPDASVVCQNGELTLDPNVTASNYIWTVVNPDNSISGPLPNERRATVDTSVPGIYQYVVSIEDPIGPGCFVNDTTTVTVNALPAGTSANIVNPSCGDSNGSFDVNISTTGSYSYVVRGNSSGVVGQSSGFVGPGTIPVTGVAPDVYTIELTDNGTGCVGSVTDIAVENTSPDFNITSVDPTDADCTTPTGSLRVTLSADVFPITYNLTNNSDGTTITNTVASAIAATTFDFEITGIAGGSYDIEVVSNGGCSQSQTGITVLQPLPVDLTVEPLVEICGPNAPLSATSTTSGVSFVWTGPGNITNANLANPTVDASGIYTVTASAAGSCDVTAQVEVELTIQPIVNILPPDDPCDGEVTLTAEVTNAQPGIDYVFNWSNGVNAQSITVTSSDTYTVTVRDPVNLTCTGVASETVTIPVPIEAVLSSTPACDDGSPFTLTAEVLSGSPTTYTWFLEGAQISTGSTNTFTNDVEGDYSVEISDGTCSITRSLTIRRQTTPEGELPEVDFYCPTNTTNNVLFAGSGFSTYEWTLDGVPYPQADQNLEVEGPGEYIVTMTTAIGCTRRDTVTVIESCDPRVLAPNAFSPVTNPPNNTFSVIPNDFVDNFEIYIYSRWGELIFQSNTLEFKWDGTFDGQLVPGGTYPYIIKFTSRFEPERGTFEQQGAVVVVR